MYSYYILGKLIYHIVSSTTWIISNKYFSFCGLVTLVLACGQCCSKCRRHEHRPADTKQTFTSHPQYPRNHSELEFQHIIIIWTTQILYMLHAVAYRLKPIFWWLIEWFVKSTLHDLLAERRDGLSGGLINPMFDEIGRAKSFTGWVILMSISLLCIFH